MRSRPHRSEWPYIYLGAYYNRQKNAAEALRVSRAKRCRSIPSLIRLYFEMAKAYRTQKELEKSAAAARRGNRDQLSDARIITMFSGLVLRELGNQKESAEALAKYAQLQHPSGECVLNTRPRNR